MKGGPTHVCRCPKTYPSLEELVKDPKIEAVFVATDAPSHARHCLDAFNHGKHVLCCVPATYGSVEDAQRLVETVEKTGLKFADADVRGHQRQGGRDGTGLRREGLDGGDALPGDHEIASRLRRPSLPPGVSAGGHGGSHGNLGHEFVGAILENRTPMVDIYEALAMTVPGIIAHRSALKDGETLKVPQFDRRQG